MRPTCQILDKSLISQIINEAVGILCSLGVEIQNEEATDLLFTHGVKKSKNSNYWIFHETHIDQAIESAPYYFGTYN